MLRLSLPLSSRTLALTVTRPTRIFTRTITHVDSAKPTVEGTVNSENNAPLDKSKHSKPERPISLLQRDAELMAKLEDISGDGGVAGLELEDGKPNAMKRGVRDNMFRVI